MSEDDIHQRRRQARKRQVSWDRAEKARLALAPYFQPGLENDLLDALTNLLVDALHLADRGDGSDSLDKELLATIVERALSFYADEEAEQHIPGLGPAKKA